jgi:hypothetical protein
MHAQFGHHGGGVWGYLVDLDIQGEFVKLYCRVHPQIKGRSLPM